MCRRNDDRDSSDTRRFSRRPGRARGAPGGPDHAATASVAEVLGGIENEQDDDEMLSVGDGPPALMPRRRHSSSDMSDLFDDVVSLAESDDDDDSSDEEWSSRGSDTLEEGPRILANPQLVPGEGRSMNDVFRTYFALGMLREVQPDPEPVHRQLPPFLVRRQLVRHDEEPRMRPRVLRQQQQQGRRRPPSNGGQRPGSWNQRR